ncbi:YraN family protein [Microbacterium limosum]|uniref:UPF0102 protein RYJ27_04930 n=1 Tax=Microbacterium limosum TaxID=3079935 RepID=A0AAU0MJ56_9MICO|nr:YraN family protein [Microbacterium sp. Y20]WOQ70554.1 YraN family protein [Microbacterium sp. Y20]
MAAKDEFGRAGEERAARYLADAGWLILARNWRCREGELDLVAQRDGVLAAVEVKSRRGIGYGHPFEAITPRKLDRLRRLAVAWAIAHPDEARGRRVRIDAIAITGDDAATAPLEHLEDVR